jgi:hypothetical protein
VKEVLDSALVLSSATAQRGRNKGDLVSGVVLAGSSLPLAAHRPPEEEGNREDAVRYTYPPLIT